MEGQKNNPYFPYYSDFHKKNSEAGLKGVERMRQHPLSREEMVAQIQRQKEWMEQQQMKHKTSELKK